VKKIYSVILITLNALFLILVPAINIVSAQENSDQSAMPSSYSTPTDETKLEGIVLEDGKKVEVTSPNRQGEILNTEQSFNAPNSPSFKNGDKVKVSIFTNPDNSQQIFITDFIRTSPLYWLFGLFVLLVLIVGRKSGFGSIVGMAISFAVLFIFIIPQITAGQNPIWTTLIGVLFILPVTFYLSHGINKKTTIALVSTFLSVCFTSLLSIFFINAAKISGYANEQAGFIQTARSGSFDIQGLLFAGIVISIIGILDDVTISQASIVNQLKIELPKAKVLELYKKAMNIGRDHIGSVVNTLILVYAGASLPLLVLFTDSSIGFNEALNNEIVAEEIVKTLVASIGLILSIPLTTILAAYFLSNDKEV
jgi:uncharacterized membrane protein